LQLCFDAFTPKKEFMKIQFLTAGRPWVGKLVAAACVAVFLPFTTPARAAMQILSGHVPAIVARLQPVENLAGSQRLNLAIGLPLRNREALTNLLQQIYDPASTNYHRYLTPEQFTEQFGPTEQDYQAVIAFAKQNGLVVTGTYSNRMLVDVSGAVTAIEKAFNVKMRLYQHPTENRTFYSPDVEPSVLSALPILDVSGLNNYALPHPQIKKIPLANIASVTTKAGSGPYGLYIGKDFRNAYAPGVTLNGSGQAVGLLEFDGFYPSDIASYLTQAGLSSVPLQIVPVDGGVSAPGFGNGEVALDIDMLIAMAPGLSRIVVFEAPNPSPWVDILNSMAADTSIKQFSCSWGGGPPSSAGDQIFQQMAAQGQSFFNASGDNDAFTGSIPFPAESPFITEVGGTTLTMSGSGGGWAAETVWNDRTPNPSGGDWGSSGGISPTYSIPGWQQGISMSANQGSTTMRNIPDVALTAENIYLVADNGVIEGSGGTSAAAPLWAGFVALVNQQAAISGQPPVGFINPAIYAIGKGENYASDFHDTTTGDNTWPGSPSQFYAVSGYDLCTGWGTPNGKNLIDAFVPPCAPDGILEVNITPANGSILIKGTNQTIYVQVTDGRSVTNATVVATIITNSINSTNLVFKNNGVDPDATANDDIYTANLIVPNNTNNLTLSFLITAPGKTNSTNVVVYSVVPIPGNDNFTNAIKIPDAGAVYLSNNRFATIESGEPFHDADASVAASLWWKWTPTGNTNVLIDTAGSAIDIVLAVYTGSTLTGLQQVAATNTTGSGKSACLTFNAVSNTTYQIAVASANSNSVGSLRFRVAPGGQPDTNAPVVFVTSPTNGFGTTNFLITVSGIANDPQPNASGVSQVFVNLNNQCTFAAAGTTNWSSTFGLTPGINNISVFAEDVAGNISAPVGIQVIYIVLLPPNDFFTNAIALTSPGQTSATNTDATKELGEPNHAGNAGGKSVWWSFQPPSDGVLTLSTTNSTFDTLLGLYTGPDVAHLTTIAANDDAYIGAPGGFSLINQAVKANQVYYIAVDGYDGDSGTVVLNYSFVPATLHHLTIASSAGGTVQVSTVNSAGGTAIMAGTSGDFANNTNVILTAYPNPYYTFIAWTTNSGSSSLNPLSFVMATDMNIFGTFGSVAFSDGFETGNFTYLPWMVNVPGNAANWSVQTNVVAAGHYAARSGVIGDSQSSSLILAGTTAAGIASFDYLVSSEQYWDFLNFYVDGVLVQQWSGEVGWATFSFPLTATNHTLEWTYVKDPSFSSGLDAAFIDNVNLPTFVGTWADVGLAMTASPNPVVVASNLTYVVAVTNYGPSAASGLSATDVLPAGVTYVSAIGSKGSPPVVNSGIITWNVGLLATNDGATLTIVVRPNSGGSVTNSAVVSSSTTDFNLGNNSASLVVTAWAVQPPRFGTSTISNGTFRLTITSPANSTIIQTSTNLVSTNWVNIYTGTPPFTFTNKAATNDRSRFYRAVSGP
jgi:uncharacterized repeat protein (TIGR01451 family)